ncbi:10194_t:CDS:1, partial [Funneliformis geosporum]
DTSSTTHISDLNSLTQDSHFDEILKINDQVKFIWILLIDEDSNENSCHMKNILQYYKIFYTFNLDYFSVQTHVSSQLAYNPIECSIITLSQKLDGIILPINKYSSHLNSQDQVVDLKLAMKNFHYT